MQNIFFYKNIVIILIKLIASFGLGLLTLEQLYNWRQMSSNGLYSWKVLGSRSFLLSKNLWSVSLNKLLDFPVVLLVLAARLGSLILLILFIGDALLEPLLLVIIILSILLVNYRHIYGQDGSDQMLSIIFITLLLNSFFSSYYLVTELCIVFIAFQSCLSYCTAGIAKLVGEKWRSGTAVFEIFNTNTYGTILVANFLKQYPGISRIMSWIVILVESSFPLVLVVGYPLALFFIVWGIVFHIMNAFIMGLNTFLWAFLATYPAILFCALSFQTMVWSLN